MSRYPVSYFLYCLLALLFAMPLLSQAQRTYGVMWEVPENSEVAKQQLERFHDLKIEYLEVNQIVSDEIWSAMRAHNFQVMVQVPVRFPVVQSFFEPDSSILKTYQEYITGYTGRQVTAMGAFAYGQTQNPAFAAAVEPYTNQLKSAVSAPVYFKDWSSSTHPVDTLLAFSIEKVEVGASFQSGIDANISPARGYIYSPDASIKDNVAPLKWFFEQTASVQNGILFFPSDWLLNFVEQHRSTGRVLAEHATYQDAVFPLPEEQIPTNSSHSLIVLILVLLWGTVALNYNFIPMYRRSLFRFFLSHRFFIEDVLDRHIRDIWPSLILFMQHAVLGGILFYSVAYIFFSSTGIEVLLAYFPMFSLFGTGYMSFFYWGSVLTFLFEIVSLIWLYIANRKIGYLSQVSILFSWPFHINLLITTVIVTLMMSGGPEYVMYTCFILFVLVLLVDFPITALDSGKKIKKNKWSYAFSTLGLYCLLLATGILTVLMNDYLLNILDLALAIT